MAEGGVSEEGLEETSKETQECSICFSEFKEPRLLECSHRFCLKCLQELKQAAQNEDDKKIVCPLCRKETILPEGGVDKLPCSQEGVTKEEHPDGGQVPKVICQVCDEESDAICRCMECEHYLCKECQRAHQRWEALRNHKIATLEELGPDSNLKDYVPKCKQHPDGGQVPKVICQACDEKNESIYRCMDCEHYLCKECQKAHQRWVAFKNHDIATLEELGPDGKLKDYVPKCKEHPDQEVCLYCTSCDVFICNKCTTSSHKAKSGHFCSSIDEAFNKCKKEINDAISQTNACIQKFTGANPLSTSHSRDRLATMLQRTKIRISVKAEREFSKIRQKEQKLKKTAEEIFYDRGRDFAYPITAEKVVSKVSKVMTTASCYEVVQSKSKLLQDLREQVKIHKSININHAASFLSFKESHDAGELGSLVLKDEWKKVKPNGRNCSCFEVFDDDIVLAGGRQLFLDDTQFSEYRTQVEVKNLSVLASVTESRLNSTTWHIEHTSKLIMLDSPEVKSLDSGGCSYLFEPSKTAGICGTATCLAVDKGGQIAVGYSNKNQISLHYSYGDHIRNLPAPGIGSHLTFSDEKLIYTHSDSYKKEVEVRCIDLEGKEIFKNVICKGHLPGLVCSDLQGIFVAASNVIWEFSTDGTYKDSLSCEVVKNPTDMKLSGSSLFMLNKEGLWECQTFGLRSTYSAFDI